ncbi:contactin-3 [Pygocentrus nattereri]|uniref:Contactin 3a, tandem duplicate 2 n=1 Tax=Pygocentrus nattereri TaxID=42514 RepID=A0A3B4DGB2_PYGNA|nr:contactin-3 [Pygocentrus nattereri]XP_017571406.1 contactin-3 [Pygocentrus nattereri]
MRLLWKQFLLLSIMEYLTECLDYKSFHGPKWRMEPSDLMAPVGLPEEEATLTCDAKGLPSPQYRWSLNGTLIDLRADQRRRLSGGNLVIRSLERAQDAGIYQCTAFNLVGAILSRRASLQFAYLNFKTQTRSAVSVREGQGVVLLCGTPTYAGDLSFAWVFNEYPYFVQQDNRRFVSQETGNLYIAKVEPSDVGNYTCVVVNRITKGKVLSSPTPLVLRTDGAMGEYEPKIEVHFPDMVPAAKGSVVTLECFALGNPVPEITWRRANGVPFPSKVKMKNSNVVLEIPSFQQEDAGGYECVAENKMGKNTVKGRLSFHAKPQWVQTMRDSALSIEERLFWECKANGKPKPSYSWLRNGELLATEDRIQIENGALTIASVNLSDAGMYQCVAENKHGIIYFSAELVVLASPPDFSRSPLRALLKAKAGSAVSMACKPQAYPTAISTWRKGNEVLQSTERTSLLPDGTLRIINVTKMDGGNYTCLARNQFGTASTTGRLLVTDPTRITQGPVDMEIIVGESIVLPCQIACDPALDVSFSWAFNGQLLSKLDPHYEHVGGSAAGDLMIRNIQLKHAGKYVCVVDTDVESLSAAAILIVKGPPGAPDGVTVEEITDSTAQLSWRPGQDNGSPIISYIVQTKTAFTVGWQAVNTVPEVIDGNTLTATVVDLNAWVEYEFRVLARNSVGVGEPSPASLKTRTEDAVPDTAPANVGGGGGSKSELVITWEPVPEELQNGDGFGYIIAMRPLGELTWTHAVTSAPGRYVYRNESIPPFSPFNIKVGAYNVKGQGPFSPVTTVFSAEEEPSGVPGGVWAQSISASEFEVSWQTLSDSPERVLGYEVVYWEDDTKPETMGKVRVPANQYTVNISGLKGYTQYFLTVSAFNTAGTGPRTPTINVTTKKSPPGQPPLNVEWNLIGSKLTVHWDPVVTMEMESEVTGYQVSYRRNRHREINTVTTNLTSVEIVLPADDDYTIQICALSDGGEGIPTEPINIHKLSMSVRGSRAWRPATIPLSLLFIIALTAMRPTL